MKCLSLIVLVAVLSVAIVPVVVAQPRYQQAVEVKIRPGYEQQFEEGVIKKFIEAADKAGSDVTWSAFWVPVGKDSPTYRVMLPFETWAERDGWPNLFAMVVEQLGEGEAQKLQGVRRQAVVSATSKIWEYIPEGSSNVNPESLAADFYQVEIREVKADMFQAYQMLQRKWKEAYEAASSKPVVSRWVLRLGPSNNLTFRRSQPFNKWGDRDRWNIPQISQEHFGEMESDLIGETLRLAVTRSHSFVSAYRADLSRAPSN